MAMTTTNQIRKGNDLMVFLSTSTAGDYEALAFATNHTLSVSMETDDIQSKDSGYNGAILPKRMTWEISSENLYIDGEYDKVFEAMKSKTAVKLKWGLSTGTDEKITADGKPNEKANAMHTPAASGLYEGEAFITSLNVNANAGENATYSVTFTGSGDFSNK